MWTPDNAGFKEQSLHTHLVVGLEPPQQPAELVVVVVLCKALLGAQDVPCAINEAVQKGQALLLARKQAAAHTRHADLVRV